MIELTLRQSQPIALDVSLTCAPGEVLALVGPSGGGKSTILRSIAGLVSPDEGRVTCNGEVWLDSERRINIQPHARSVGIVFQSYALFPHMSVEGNVMAALDAFPASERQARAHDLVARVNLAGLEKRKPAQLSGGQQQRVALARALAREPKVLLLDEPFAAVDEMTRVKLRRELLLLHRRLAIPILLVTHDIEEAVALGDQICIIHHGVGLQIAKPEEILTRPVSPLVARLVGMRNIFEAEIIAHDPSSGCSWLEWGGRRLEVPHCPQFNPKSRVSWVIPSADVLLHNHDRPSRGRRENPFYGTIIDMLDMGGITTVNIGLDNVVIEMTLPRHVASRNSLAPGVGVTVSLLAASIHVMSGTQEQM
jgi:molybdate transport system ATP-binding protein